MKKMDLGKRTKKLLMQGISVPDIAKICGSDVFSVLEAYSEFNPRVFKTKAIKNLLQLVKNNAKIQVYGNTGSGKTFSVSKIAKLSGREVSVSYPRTEEDLGYDFGDAIFDSDSSTIFVIEGDSYYWKKYGLVKNILEESPNCVIIITTKKDTPTAWITKLVDQVKIYSPLKSDVIAFMTAINCKKDITEVYNRDWRKVYNSLFFGMEENGLDSEPEKLSAKNVVYKLFTGTASYSDFENCEHPLSFILNWIGYNAHNWFNKTDFVKWIDAVSYIDTNKYNLKDEYLIPILLELPYSNRKGELKFPPFKKVKPEKVKDEESEFVVKKSKRQKVKKRNTQPTLDKFSKKKQEYSLQEEDDLGDFMLL